MKNGMTSLVVGFALIFWALFSVVSQWKLLSEEEVLWITTNATAEEMTTERNDEVHSAKKHYIYTAKGLLSYEDIEAKVFRPNNFRIREPCSPVPKLEFINKPTCESIFEEWLKIATIRNNTSAPPRRIPADRLNKFLLNGYAFLQHRYLDNRTSPEPLIWDDLPELLYYEPDKLTRYGEQGLSIYYALLDYPLLGKVGFVIGSQSAWVEAHALISGADKVFTIEYRRIIIQGDHNITYIHPIDFAKEWRRYNGTFDFAISFSSIEHSGLGRYGDPLDPIGDLREAQKTLCLLKKGGIFFLAVPRGVDMVLFNAHRYYGRMRLAMLMAGFEWITTYRGTIPHGIFPTLGDFENPGMHLQDLYVLRKL